MKHSIKITLLLVLFFLVSQIVGLGVITKYVDTKKTAETGTTIFQELPFKMERPDVPASSSFILIAIAVILGTIIALFLIKYKQMMIWKIWYFLAVILCLSISFNPFITAIPALILGIVLASLKIWKNNVIIHNLTELFIYSGIAAIFVPIMNIYSAIILLVLISIYDIIAVWHTKHMITLAETQNKEKVFAGFAIPYSLSGAPQKTVITSKTGGSKLTADKISDKKTSKTKEETRTAILGGGDIAFPLLFSGVIMLKYGFFGAVIVSIVTAAALLFLLLKAEAGKYYPAMPFISAGCLLGYGLLFLIQ